MELRLLKYFLAITREESILKAAESLHVTQPTLSRQMKELEDYLGKQLFIRGNRKITLTDEGYLLKQRAEEILKLVQKTENDIKVVDEIINGEIYIGSGETIGMKIISKAIHRCQEEYPHIKFHLYSGNEEEITDRLDKCLLDFGLVIHPANIYKYHYLNLPHEDIWGIYIRKDHPLASKKTITPKDLLTVPLLRSVQEKQYQLIETWSKKTCLKYDTLATYNLVYNASILAKECNCAVISLKNLLNTSGDSCLRFIPLEPTLTSRLSVIWKKDKAISKAAQCFLKILDEQISG